MSFTIETTLDAFTATIAQKARLDPGVRAGTMMLFDTANPACNPLTATGAIPNSTVFKNIADLGLNNGTVAVTNLIYNGPTGGISTANATTGGGNVISYGTGFDLKTPNPDFMVMLWAKILSTANGSGPYSNMFSLGNSSSNLFDIDTGGDNQTIRGTATTTGGSPGLPNFGSTKDVPHLLGITRAGSILQYWVDGVVVGTGTNGNSILPDMSAVNLLLGSYRAGSTIYRAALERLDLSYAEAAAFGTTLTAASAMAAEYAIGLANGYS